jgi:hypothetical protein
MFYYQRSSTLPINGSAPNGMQSKRAPVINPLYGSEEAQMAQNISQISSSVIENGTSIRPVGSAPDLAVKNWNNLGPGIMRMPIRPALRQQPQQNFTAVGMVRMPHPHVPPHQKRKKNFASSLNASNSMGG